MSFETELLASIGTSTDAWDLRFMVRRCFFYDFDGYPTRLWHGQGALITAGDVEWLGTIDGGGTDHHQAPQVSDIRDGASPQYEFGLPYLDEATYDALKADQSLAAGRAMTCYQVYIDAAEGLRPGTAVQFNYKLEIVGLNFNRSYDASTGTGRRTYSASAIMRHYRGRSFFPGGTYTDTSQRLRASLLGVTADSGCTFVAGNSRRTYVVGGG